MKEQATTINLAQTLERDGNSRVVSIQKVPIVTHQYMDEVQYYIHTSTILTFDSKHSMAEVFEVDFPMGVGVQVTGQRLHLQEMEVNLILFKWNKSLIPLPHNMDTICHGLSFEPQQKKH